ncbi:SocA family protein [Corynebacterium uropygiale]|uniref:SocA family protein n=1 Tax=Corynebacterium uropygiale TaxID=1775911 RepID=A0A9X1TZP1_9CORY|nr:Panacea domain-containing protein [Corynebacterium uropygiale]MCF4005583.1 SocA family protein [Corynebacterium uropygiale]
MMSTQTSAGAVKAAQAFSFFIHSAREDHRSVDGETYLKLIKLLWAADRLSLRHCGQTVSEDRYSAMRYGPVASEAYSLVGACKPGAPAPTTWCSSEDSEWWRDHFEAGVSELQLIRDPGDDHLSCADTMMLEKAYAAFRTTPRFVMADDISHRYPEWTRAFTRGNPRTSSVDIDMEDFFADPDDGKFDYFHVDADTLNAAREFYRERQEMAVALGFTR